MANQSTPVSLPSQMYVKKPGDTTSTKKVGNQSVTTVQAAVPATGYPMYGMGKFDASMLPTAPAGDAGTDYSLSGDVLTPAERAAAAKANAVNQLRAEILAKGGDIEAIYNTLFGDLDSVVRSRDSELETQYGEQFKKAGDQYADAIPEIETSYAAIGAADSTDSADGKDKAKAGFDETTATIGKNKQTDKAKLGQYSTEQRAKIGADKEAAKRNVARVGETDDPDALRSMRNEIETNLSGANVVRAQLGTDAGARGEVARLTGDAGRFDSAVNALDSIIKSSMSGSVKEAAVKAITDNAGLSDEEKQKVQQQFGNVYAEQAAL